MELTCANASNGGFNTPQVWNLVVLTVDPAVPGERPSTDNWHWEWLMGNNPRYNNPAYVVNTTVYPKETSQSESVCKLYYAFKIS